MGCAAEPKTEAGGGLEIGESIMIGSLGVEGAIEVGIEEEEEEALEEALITPRGTGGGFGMLGGGGDSDEEAGSAMGNKRCINSSNWGSEAESCSDGDMTLLNKVACAFDKSAASCTR